MTVKDLIAELSEIPGDYEIEVALFPMTPEDEEVDLDEDPSSVSVCVTACTGTSGKKSMEMKK
jgi:hypothetical protein